MCLPVCDSISRSFALASVWMTFFALAVRAEGPPRDAAASRAPKDNWTITLKYGFNTPHPNSLGTCTAIFDSTGHVKIEAKERPVRVGTKRTVQDFILYENDDLSPELVRAIAVAADAALKERPINQRTRGGEIFHPAYLELDRSGTAPLQVHHTKLETFSEAPPAMRQLFALIYSLLPMSERFELGRHAETVFADRSATEDALPEWAIQIRLGRSKSGGESKVTREARFAASGILAAPDKAILRGMVADVVKETPQNGGADEGVFVKIESLDASGQVVAEHHDDRLSSYGRASPATVRVLHWLNDHLPKAERIDLKP